jgi:multidrug transporter EmrE-like cation transporter
VSTLQANWEWLILTGIGLALAIVFGLVIFGSQRAPEHVFRIAGGIIGIVVVIPAVLK